MKINLRGPGGQYSFVALQNPDTTSCYEHKKPIKETIIYKVNWLHFSTETHLNSELIGLFIRKCDKK